MADDVDALVRAALDYGDAVAATQRDLERLAGQRREAVLRLREAGLSFGQIADRLDITRSGVQSILRGPKTGS